MKFGQLIEYNRKIFVENLYTKCGGETIPGPFLEKSKLSIISGSIVLSFIQFVFTVCYFEGYRDIVKPSCRPLFTYHLI